MKMDNTHIYLSFGSITFSSEMLMFHVDHVWYPPKDAFKTGNLGQLHPVADMIYCSIILLTEELTNYTGAVTVKWTYVTGIS